MRRAYLALGAAAGVTLAIAAGWVALAQPTGSAQTPPPSSEPSSAAGPPGVPTIEAPPENAAPPAAAPPDEADNSADADETPTNKPAAPKAAEAKPPPPPMPLRSPAAILQVLDKVTAETMRFAAPVGQRVRYKNLVFTVKACETTGLSDPSPRASAYLVVDSAPLGVEGMAPAPPKRVFRGWMFANSPGLNPLQHPIYDAWLIACMAAAPPA